MPARLVGNSVAIIDHSRSLRIMFDPDFDGALFSIEWKEALWARFCTAAPRQQRRSLDRLVGEAKLADHHVIVMVGEMSEGSW